MGKMSLKSKVPYQLTELDSLVFVISEGESFYFHFQAETGAHARITAMLFMRVYAIWHCNRSVFVCLGICFLVSCSP